MNRVSWIAFFVLLFVALFVIWRIEESRWKNVLDSAKQVAQAARESDERAETMIKALRTVGEEEKAKSFELREKSRDNARKAAFDAIDQRFTVWEIIPGNLQVWREEKATSLATWVLVFSPVVLALLCVANAIRRNSKQMDRCEKSIQRLGDLDQKQRALEEAKARVQRRTEQQIREDKARETQRAALEQERSALEQEYVEFDEEAARVERQAEEARQEMHQARVLFEEAQGSEEKKNGVALMPVEVRRQPAMKIGKPWRFSMTFDITRKAEQLPSDQEGFVETLGCMMKEVRYADLDPRVVYRKLLTIMEMDAQQRNRMKKIKYDNCDLDGWTSARIGAHRLFLRFDENERHMTLHLRPRKDAYTYAYRRD